ncbi:glycosyltransferase [Pontibacter pudoricolor]|uniref:glycosyltransferase n=1 Tax=Pontibacter pudoricolor TaxID=2694930 RepID=UPI00139195E4|nr:glycosyltransferase [Pontibacter pudoricolor]
MNIAFLCRWKLSDGLTVSTVAPHLEALAGMQNIRQIVFLTLEDTAGALGLKEYDSILKHDKVKWLPLRSSNYKRRLFNQIADYRNGYKALRKVLTDEKIDLLIAHGAPAGAVADKATKVAGTPFIVSLFEPHADYMLESGVWSKFGLKYNMQKQWEKQQLKNAAGLMPVTLGYKQKLLTQGVYPGKIVVIPCSVDYRRFQFDVQRRLELRKQLGWEKATIGIYAGKFGGLYYTKEAFQIYEQCFRLIPDFRLIILSPQPQEGIQQQLRNYKIDLSKVYVDSVPHELVPAYLSAADFTLATYKPGPSKKYLSPVKIGEYWANGLPVLLTEGIGDDSDIIKNEGGGALFNLTQTGSLEKAIQQIQTIVSDPNHRQRIPQLAANYRSPERIREAYEYFFNKLSSNGL